jgi:hypothetical protein
MIKDRTTEHIFRRVTTCIAALLLCVLCIEPALTVIENIVAADGVTPAHGLYAAKKKPVAKKGKKRRRKKRSKPRSLPKPFLKDVAYDSTLAPGVTYSKMIMGSGKYSLHVITVDYEAVDDNVRIEAIKGRDLFNGLERVRDIVARRDSIGPDTLLGAINANFWKAYYNTPINPTVINGEVLEMEQYKQWSSAFFDEDGKLYIDRFSISGSLRNKKGQEWAIASVNKRHEENGIVLYNTFSGDTIPYVKSVSVEELSKETLDNFTLAEYDSTESAPALTELMQAANEKKREGLIEYPMRKARVRYLGSPLVNKKLRCVVTALDTGTVIVPQNGAVISFGKDIPLSELPARGDTLSVLFRTNISDKVPFEFAVGGTPRLVRNGKAAHEASIEGSTARRFISGNLSRTAVGVDKTGTLLYLVAVDGTHRGNGTRGMTLSELAGVMHDLGAWNALNLDGGGSVSMVVGGDNVVRIGGGEFNRKVSVALGVVKKYIEPVARTEKPAAPVKNTYVKGAEPEYAAEPLPAATSDSSQTMSRRDQLRAEQLRKEKERQERVRQEQLRRREQSQPERRRTPGRTPQR